MLDQEPLLGAATVTVHHRGLKREGVVGWQEQESTHEHLVEIETTLSRQDYITTLIHELIHVRQNLEGIDPADHDRREEEAYNLEAVYSARFQNA